LYEVEQTVSTNLRRYVISSSQGIGGPVPSATWNAVLGAITELRPNLADDIKKLQRLAEQRTPILNGAQARLWSQEREALGAALDIFAGSELRTQVLEGWQPSGEKGADAPSTNARFSFLQGLESALSARNLRYSMT
jgi:hypothetical protein